MSMTTIEEMALYCSVTKLAYKNWKNKKTIPGPDKITKFIEILRRFQDPEVYKKQYLKNLKRVRDRELRMRETKRTQAKLKRIEGEKF